MRKLLGITLLVLSATMAVAGPKPWPNVKYTTVKAYIYNLEEKLMGKHDPVKEGKLDTTMLKPGTELSTTQVSDVIKLANESTNLLQLGLSSCYIPHHAIVFFDADDKPVAWVSICFMCDAARFYPIKRTNQNEQSNPKKEKAVKAQLNRLKNIMLDLKIPVFSKPEEYLNYSATLSYPKADSVEIEMNGFARQHLKTYKWALDAFKEFNLCESDRDSTFKVAGGGTKYYFFTITSNESELRFSRTNQSYALDYARIRQFCFKNILAAFPVTSDRKTMFNWLKKNDKRIVVSNRFIIKDAEAHLKFTFLYNEKETLSEIAIDMY